jgi:hypothetical protein
MRLDTFCAIIQKYTREHIDKHKITAARLENNVTSNEGGADVGELEIWEHLRSLFEYSNFIKLLSSAVQLSEIIGNISLANVPDSKLVDITHLTSLFRMLKKYCEDMCYCLSLKVSSHGAKRVSDRLSCFPPTHNSLNDIANITNSDNINKRQKLILVKDINSEAFRIDPISETLRVHVM